MCLFWLGEGGGESIHNDMKIQSMCSIQVCHPLSSRVNTVLHFAGWLSEAIGSN